MSSQPTLTRPIMVDASGLPIGAISHTLINNLAAATSTSRPIASGMSTAAKTMAEREAIGIATPKWLLISLVALLLVYVGMDLPRAMARLVATTRKSPRWVGKLFGLQDGDVARGGEVGKGWFLRGGSQDGGEEVIRPRWKRSSTPSSSSRSSFSSELPPRLTEKEVVAAGLQRSTATMRPITEVEETILAMEEKAHFPVDTPIKSVYAEKNTDEDDDDSAVAMSAYRVPHDTIPHTKQTQPEIQPSAWRPTWVQAVGMAPVDGSNNNLPTSVSMSRQSSVTMISRQSSVASFSTLTHEGHSRAPSTVPFAGSPNGRGRFVNAGSDSSDSGTTTTSPPPHVSPLTSYIPFAHRIFLYTPFPRFFPHVTTAGIVLTLIYILMVLLAVFFRTGLSFNKVKNPAGVDYFRSGFVALGQVPVVVALGGRNSFVRMLLGGGENASVQRIHKLVGRSIFACIFLHMGLYWHKWIVAGAFASASKKGYVVAGYASTLALFILVLTSLPFIRNRFYAVFKVCHFIGIFGFLIGLALHIKQAVPWVIASFVLYGVEQLLRVVKLRYVEASLVALQGADTTMITVDSVKSGWRAGQHVVLRVPGLASKVGPQAMEGHPFTIASAPDANGLVLMAKNTGNWTNALYEMAVADTASREKGTQGVKTKVLLEGPYGGPGHTVFASYSSLCLIGGGSGITFPLGVARDLVRKANLGQVRARTIDLVWIVRTQDIARPMIQELQELVEEAKAAEADRYSDNVTALRVHVYITRVPTSSPINLLPSNPRDEPDQIPSAAPSINYRHRSTLEVTGRRPQLMDLVFNAVEDTERVRVGGKESANGCGVVVCGPAGLVTDVRHVVSSVKEDDRIACGGLELHEEFFAV